MIENLWFSGVIILVLILSVMALVFIAICVLMALHRYKEYKIMKGRDKRHD